MLLFITSVRPYLEVISFTATIILVIGLLFARSQLVAFSRDANIRNERLAKEKAIEAATRYLTEYVRLSGIDYKRRIELKAPSFEIEIGDFTAASLRKSDIKQMSEWCMKIETTLVVINELEIISSYFVTRVADERTGFAIIGRSFCYSVKSYYHYISLLRGDVTAQPHWHNIVALYQLWSPRLTREELEETSNKLSKTIAGLPVDRPITPLGC